MVNSRGSCNNTSGTISCASPAGRYHVSKSKLVTSLMHGGATWSRCRLINAANRWPVVSRINIWTRMEMFSFCVEWRNWHWLIIRLERNYRRRGAAFCRWSSRAVIRKSGRAADPCPRAPVGRCPPAARPSQSRACPRREWTRPSSPSSPRKWVSHRRILFITNLYIAVLI